MTLISGSYPQFWSSMVTDSIVAYVRSASSLLACLAILSAAGCFSNSDDSAQKTKPNTENAVESSSASTPSPPEAESTASNTPAPPEQSRRSGGVFFVEPKQYAQQRAAYSKTASGAVVQDVVLLPADVPDVPSQPSTKPTDFVGAKACGECHAEKLASFSETGHFNTSSLASHETVLGEFGPEDNRLTTQSENLSFEMFEDDDAFYQRLVLVSNGETLGADFPIDIVTGSGKTAQTYLRWQGERLYQLHATYFVSESRWVNSPGFDDGVANFARPIHAVCLECHSTYFEPVENTTNQFHKHNFMLGISCERCHGPGKLHVTHHQKNPDEKEARAITNPSKLTRDREIEVCQVCHGGLPTGMKQPPFSFRPGDKLDEFYEYANHGQQKNGIHTNTQLPRLQQSACFQQSESMTCSTCHNPHQHESGNTRLFSERCITCHEPDHCGKFEEVGAKIAENCIDCHMPSVELQDITFHSESGQQSPTVKDHYIRVVEE